MRIRRVRRNPYRDEFGVRLGRSDYYHWFVPEYHRKVEIVNRGVMGPYQIFIDGELVRVETSLSKAREWLGKVLD